MTALDWAQFAVLELIAVKGEIYLKKAIAPQERLCDETNQQARMLIVKIKNLKEVIERLRVRKTLMKSVRFLCIL